MAKFYQKIIDNKEYFFIISISILSGFFTFYNFVIEDTTLFHDPYYRFARALQYDKTGSFFIFESIPWTKPFDLIFYYTAKILQFIFHLDMKLSLIISGAIFCAFCYGLSLYYIYKNASYLKFSLVSKSFILISFALMPEIYDYFFPLRVDHHMFLLMLSILFWGLNLKALESDRENTNLYVFFSALISSIAIWVHIEFLVLVAVFEIFLFLNWCFITKKYCTSLFFYNLASACFLALFFLIENEGLNNFFTPVYDSLSIVQISIFIILSINSVLLYCCYFQSMRCRFLSLLLLASIDLLFFYKFFGYGFFNPYFGLDAYAVENFFPIISEFQPFFRPLNFAVMVYVILLSILMYGLSFNKSYQYFFKNTQIQLLQKNFLNNFYLLSLFLVLSLLMFKNVRWSYYVYPLLIFMAAPTIGRFVETLDKKGLVFRFTGSEFIYAFLIVNVIVNIGVSYKYFIFIVMPESIRQDYKKKYDCHNDTVKYIKKDILKDYGHNNNFTVMVDSDHGPLTIYETPYKVIATNNHRNSNGLKAVKDFYSSKLNNNQLSDLVKKYQINLFITCKYQDFNFPDWLENKKIDSKYKYIDAYMVK